jgi:hypothetical protein
VSAGVGEEGNGESVPNAYRVLDLQVESSLGGWWQWLFNSMSVFNAIDL